MTAKALKDMGCVHSHCGGQHAVAGHLPPTVLPRRCRAHFASNALHEYGEKKRSGESILNLVGLLFGCVRCACCRYDITLCIGEEGKAWTEAFGFQYLELASFVLILERPELRHAAETGGFKGFMASVAFLSSGLRALKKSGENKRRQRKWYK